MSSDINHDLRAFWQEFSRAADFPMGRDQSRPAADFEMQSQAHALAMGPAQGLLLFEGVVLDAVGYAHSYTVALDNGGTPPMRALAVTPSGTLALSGVRQTTTYPPGSRVLCGWRQGSEECLILGGVPDPNIDPREGLSDLIVPGGNAGVAVDSYLRGALLVSGPLDGYAALDDAAIVDASCGRPHDSLTGGESGLLAETGVGLHVDPFMTFLRVSETTGVFGFYHGSLLRVAGHNFQLTTSGSEREDGDDGHFTSSEEGFSPLLYEVCGAPADDVAAFRDLTAQAWQKDEPWYFAKEPVHDDQQPFYRWRNLKGYLAAGGGDWSILQAWPSSLLNGALPDSQRLFRWPQSLICPGLYSSQTMPTGRHVTRSALGFFLVKTPRIVSPKRKRPPLQQQGDLSPSAPLPVVPALAVPAGALAAGESPLLRAADAVDQMVYAANYEGTAPVAERPDAWYLPDESDGVTGGDWPADVPPEYDTLQTLHHLPTPAGPVTVEIDGRYGQATVLGGTAFIAVLDDGGIVLCDGWGSEIKMTGGNIYQSCAGDLFNMTGRNVNVWSGQDVILRAHNSADLSAAQGDVRIKAQRELFMLGGNEGVCGGVLIESRAPSASYQPGVGDEQVVAGIVLKASNSQVVSVAQDVVVRSERFAVAPPCDGGSSSTQLVFDVGDEGRIVTYSKAFERRMATGGYALDVIGGLPVMELREDRALIDTPLVSATGRLAVGGCLTAGGWITTAGGHFASSVSQTSAWHGLVAALSEAAAADASAVLVQSAQRAEALEDYLAAEPAPGRQDHLLTASGDVCDCEFNFRTDTQYRAAGGSAFVLYEARWQQTARISGQTLPVWQEPSVPVTHGGGVTATRPHPGHQAWSVSSSGRRLSPVLYDDAQGMAADRDDAGYATAEMPEPSSYILEGNYVVIVNASSL